MAKSNISNNILPADANELKEGGGQIVLYQPDESISLEVKLDVDADTVWLSQQQIADLFGVQKAAISKHMKNIFNSNELVRNRVVSKMETTASDGKRYQVDYYNLDMILSVGYRVNSVNATRFRQWANTILKDYLVRGYSLSRHIIALQERFDNRMTAIENRQEFQQQQLDFFIRTSTPPAEMVFYNGEFFTARVAIESLIKTAKQRVIIIDHYIDAKTFDMFDVRSEGVQGIIYTQGVGSGMTRLKQEHDSQLNVQPVEVYKWRVEPHDRWLIIDDQLYHCGHSLNATGRKLSAITLMGTSPEDILSQMI